MCFHYGKYGHKDVDCPSKIPTGENVEVAGNMQDASNGPPIHRPEVTEEFSPWILVQRQRRKLRSMPWNENQNPVNHGEFGGNQKSGLQGS